MSIFTLLRQAHSNPRDERIFVLLKSGSQPRALVPMRHFERVFEDPNDSKHPISENQTLSFTVELALLPYPPSIGYQRSRLQLLAKQLEPYTRGLNLREYKFISELALDFSGQPFSYVGLAITKWSSIGSTITSDSTDVFIRYESRTGTKVWTHVSI